MLFRTIRDFGRRYGRVAAVAVAVPVPGAPKALFDLDALLDKLEAQGAAAPGGNAHSTEAHGALALGTSAPSTPSRTSTPPRDRSRSGPAHRTPAAGRGRRSPTELWWRT